MSRSSALAGIVLLACCLTACGKRYKPESTPPTPPLVDCDAGPAELLPDAPKTDQELAEWARKVAGAYEAEAIKRAEVRACLTRLREAGAIR